MMNSMQWSDEECRYVQAMLEWQDAPEQERSTMYDLTMRRARTDGEFRILVAGVEGVGKTSLMARFCTDTFPDPKLLETNPPQTRHQPVAIDGKTFTIDTLELPATHLPASITDTPGQPTWKTDPTVSPSATSTFHLEQALAITESAMVIYSVRDAASFEAAVRLAAYIRAATAVPMPGYATSWTSEHKRRMGPQHKPKKREYGIVLVGNKSEADLTEDVYDEHMNTIQPDSSDHIHRVSETFARLEGDGPRQVSEQAGSDAAGLNAFLEVSALTGENVRAAFVTVAKEALRCRGDLSRPPQPKIVVPKEDESKGMGFLKRMRNTKMVKKMGTWSLLNAPFLKR